MLDRYDPFEINIAFQGESVPEDTTRVVNLRKSLPIARPDNAEKLVKAGLAATWASLSKDEWHSIAHAVTDIDAVSEAIRTSQHFDVYGESAMLTMMRTEVMLTSVFPLLQPRIAGQPAASRPPLTSGLLSSGKPVAGLVIRFDDEQHLRQHLREQIDGTLRDCSDLRSSILSHGVTEPVLLYPALLVFGEQELDVMAVGDGITRCIRSWHNIFGGTVAAPDLAGEIVDSLLARSSSRRRYSSESGARRDGRREMYLKFRAQVASYGENHQNAEVVRISQSLTVPANIAVGFRSLLASAEKGVEHQFQDALGSAVAQIHTLGRPWGSFVVGANVMNQAIKRAVAEGVLAQTVAEVALGAREVDALSVDDLDLVPDKGLARAVVLASILLNPSIQKALKRNIRSLRGLKRVTKNNYSSMALSVLDQPWRRFKDHSRSNASSAWKVGGPIPQLVHGLEFEPLLGSDYLDLVKPALDGGHPDHWRAKATLMVAGGIALTADGLLLAPTGSSTQQAPDRISPHQRVELLAGTEVGLCALAHAANSFRSDREASNSYSTAQRHKLNDLGSVTVYAVQRPASGDDPYIAEADPNYSFADVARLSDLSRLAAATSDNVDRGGANELSPERTGTQKAAELRGRLLDQLNSAAHTVAELVELLRTDQTLLVAEDLELWRRGLEAPAKRTFTEISRIADELEAVEDRRFYANDADDNADNPGDHSA